MCTKEVCIHRVIDHFVEALDQQGSIDTHCRPDAAVAHNELASYSLTSYGILLDAVSV